MHQMALVLDKTSPQQISDIEDPAIESMQIKLGERKDSKE